MNPAEQQAFKQSWTSHIGRGAAFELEFRLRRADGLYRWMQARGRPTTDARGSILEWLVVCVEIHDQKLWLSSPESLTVTGAQLRAARGILNWSVRQLADAAGVAVSVVRRLEEIDGPPTTFEASFSLIKQRSRMPASNFFFHLWASRESGRVELSRQILRAQAFVKTKTVPKDSCNAAAADFLLKLRRELRQRRNFCLTQMQIGRAYPQRD